MANQHTNTWTPEQEAELAALYPTHTVQQLTVLLGRSVRSLEAKTRKMGLQKVLLAPFSPEEKALIAYHYPLTGTKELLTLIPGVDPIRLNDYASRHKIRYMPVSVVDETVLRELCAQGLSYDRIAAAMGGNRSTVRYHAIRLGLDKAPQPKFGNPSTRKARAEKAPRIAKPKAVKAPKVKAARPAKVAAPRPLALFKQESLQREVRAMNAQGRTLGYMALALNCGTSTIDRALRDMGLSRERPAATWRVTQAPKMQVVKDDYRFQPKAACGKKAPSKVVAGGEKTSEYLKSLPRNHPHLLAYERLTRPREPRRDLRYKAQFLAALEETSYALAA